MLGLAMMNMLSPAISTAMSLSLNADGENVIKFDYGVTITGFAEVAGFGGVRSVTLTLSTGARVIINSPAEEISSGVFRFGFVLGEGTTMNYTEFKATVDTALAPSGGVLTVATAADVPMKAELTTTASELQIATG